MRELTYQTDGRTDNLLSVETFFVAMFTDPNVGIVLDEGDFWTLPATDAEYAEYFADRDIDSDAELHDANIPRWQTVEG
jgi:hypothetical protein